MMSRTFFGVALALAGVIAAQASSRPELSGTWQGLMTERHGEKAQSYPMTLRFDGDRGFTTYAGPGCRGQLDRIAATPDGYTVYHEKIVKGRADAGGTCIDGIVILSQARATITLGWYGSDRGEPVLASAVLTQAPD